MSEIGHLPVRPNIGNFQRMNNNMNSANSHPDIFMGNTDPDVQSILNKKQNIVNMETQITKEERLSRLKEKEKKNSSQEMPLERKRDNQNDNQNEKSNEKNQGTSWIIIALAFIVIILIIIIVYYVISYNTTLLNTTIIPEKVIRPSKAEKFIENRNDIYLTVPKPKNYIEPTKNDLNSVLSKLETINEESDEENHEHHNHEHNHSNEGQQNEIKTEEIKREENKKDEYIYQPVHHHVQKIEKIVEIVEDANNKVDENEKKMDMFMNETLENMILDDNYDNTFEDHEFVDND